MKITAINTNLNIRNNKNTTFEGNFVPKFVSSGYDKLTDKIATGIGKVIDTKAVQNFSKKYHDTNIATHIFSATGILLSKLKKKEKNL